MIQGKKLETCGKFLIRLCESFMGVNLYDFDDGYKVLSILKIWINKVKLFKNT